MCQELDPEICFAYQVCVTTNEGQAPGTGGISVGRTSEYNRENSERNQLVVWSA